jgi:hypothetical protein
MPKISFSPVFCRRCHIYVNRYVTFTEVGRKFRCNVCTMLNDGTFLLSYIALYVTLLIGNSLRKN